MTAMVPVQEDDGIADALERLKLALRRAQDRCRRIEKAIEALSGDVYVVSTTITHGDQVVVEGTTRALARTADVPLMGLGKTSAIMEKAEIPFGLGLNGPDAVEFYLRRSGPVPMVVLRRALANYKGEMSEGYFETLMKRLRKSGRIVAFNRGPTRFVRLPEHAEGTGTRAPR